jgi:hypothetical protein
MRIFRPKRKKATEGQRKLHNEFHNFYSSPNIITVIKSRRMRWAGHVELRPIGKIRNIHKTVVGKPKCKRPLGETEFRRQNDINSDLEK